MINQPTFLMWSKPMSQGTSILMGIGFRGSRGTHHGGITRISDEEITIRIRTEVKVRISPIPTITIISTVAQ